MGERARRAELVVEEHADRDADDGCGRYSEVEGSAQPPSDLVATATEHRPPDSDHHEQPYGQEQREQGRSEKRSEHQVSLGRRSGTTVFFAGSSRSYAATSTAIVNGIEAGTHMIPAASCWSASADSPPGRWASAA